MAATVLVSFVSRAVLEAWGPPFTVNLKVVVGLKLDLVMVSTLHLDDVGVRLIETFESFSFTWRLAMDSEALIHQEFPIHGPLDQYL